MLICVNLFGRKSKRLQSCLSAVLLCASNNRKNTFPERKQALLSCWSAHKNRSPVKWNEKSFDGKHLLSEPLCFPPSTRSKLVTVRSKLGHKEDAIPHRFFPKQKPLAEGKQNGKAPARYICHKKIKPRHGSKRVRPLFPAAFLVPFFPSSAIGFVTHVGVCVCVCVRLCIHALRVCDVWSGLTDDRS